MEDIRPSIRQNGRHSTTSSQDVTLKSMGGRDIQNGPLTDTPAT
jgi:hypothetical protein